mmetsp:Transcript_23435/g.69620  ORF Transcript_23435/g.69620 Transcript_23435/m.69620 type:complete len:212 (+) Transcript_23435:466-1101(+)
MVFVKVASRAACRAARGRATHLGDLTDHRCTQFHKLPGRRTCGVRHHKWPSAVPSCRQVLKDRETNEVWEAKVLLDALAAAFPKRKICLAIRLEIAHVLHHSNARHHELCKHADALCDVDECKALGRRHNDRGIKCHSLAQCQLDVPRARWEVHHKVVKLTPFTCRQHLCDEARHHRSAHDRRALSSKAERHCLDALKHSRLESLCLWIHL